MQGSLRKDRRGNTLCLPARPQGRIPANEKAEKWANEKIQTTNEDDLDLTDSRGDRTRTCDSLVPNQERYQLRYTPKNRPADRLLQSARAKVVLSFCSAKFSYSFFPKTFLPASEPVRRPTGTGKGWKQPPRAPRGIDDKTTIMEE
jgi:hypothetical protein